MADLKIAFVGAGSYFARHMAVDLLLSEVLRDLPSRMLMMDVREDAAQRTCAFARAAAERLSVSVHSFEATADLARALEGADYVLCAVERDRRKTWRQDFQIPLRHGFQQAMGECGGPGGLFHFLRNMVIVLDIVRAMEQFCPQAPLLCFTNPENRIPYAVNQLSSIRAYGFCHGVFMGAGEIAKLLGRPVESLDYSAAGLNHFTWFTRLQDRESGEDLYPLLRRRDAEVPLEKGPVLDRLVFRRFGLWPSPGGNHLAEYIPWAAPFTGREQWLNVDALSPEPEEKEEPPGGFDRVTDVSHEDPQRSGELPIPLIEALSGGVERRLEAIIFTNQGAIPNLPEDAAVEVPALAGPDGVRLEQVGPLPEAIAAMCRTQISIHKLALQAFVSRSRDVLMQAVLIDPVIDRYEAAVAMVEEFLALQREYLPPFE